MPSSMSRSSLTAPQKALFRTAREGYEFDFIRNGIESAQTAGEQHVVTKLERNKDASTTTATTFALANLGGEALEAGPAPCEEWTLSYDQAEKGTVTRKEAPSHSHPPRYEEVLRLELWTSSKAANLSHDRYHSARPQTPLLPILIRARPGQRLTTPLARDEKEQVDTAREAAPATVIAKVPMGQLRSIVDIRGEHMARLRRVVIDQYLRDRNRVLPTRRGD